MSARYTATFDSLHPMRGVVVDEEAERFALFPSLERAQQVAEKMNRLALMPLEPQLADVLTWRSTVTGKPIDSSPDSGPGEQ